LELGVGEIINKELKNVSFCWIPESKELAIFEKRFNDKTGVGTSRQLGLTRTEMFSLMRFIIRIAQKGQRRKRK
jgi:hypothetical protein